MTGDKQPKKESKKDDYSAISANSFLNTPITMSVLESVRAANDLASGLSVGMLESGFLKNYRSAIDQQEILLQTASALSPKALRGLASININDYIDRVVLPNSGTIAEIGLASINTSKLFGTGSILASQVEATQKVTGLFLETLGHQQVLANSVLQTIDVTGNIPSLSTTLPASSMLISSSLNLMARSLPGYPSEIVIPTLETASEPTEITEEEISEHQQLIDKLLSKVDPALVEFRLGVWSAFQAKKPDYIGQASSSMRRLIDNLLRALAPEEEVTKTDFFKNSPKGKDDKGKPTRRARVFYAMKYDEKKASHLNRLTDGFLTAYDNLSAWDHTPLRKDTFVRGALLVIEGHLMSFLSECVE